MLRCCSIIGIQTEHSSSTSTLTEKVPHKYLTAAIKLCMGVWPGAHKRRTPCKFESMPVDAECSVSNGPPTSATSLLSLQTNVLEHILLSLHLTDLARCCQVCKGLRSIVQQDDIWQLLCTNRFPSLTCTELKQWLRVKAFPISAKHPDRFSNSSAACTGSGDSASTYRHVMVSYRQSCFSLGCSHVMSLAHHDFYGGAGVCIVS